MISSLEIRKWPDPYLSRRCMILSRTELRSSELQRLIDDMINYVAANRGRVLGIAANQLGICSRLVVVDAGSNIMEFVNPDDICLLGDRFMSVEGCASLPGIRRSVERQPVLRFTAFNRFGEESTFVAQYNTAIVLQHEFDHLNGILITSGR